MARKRKYINIKYLIVGLAVVFVLFIFINSQIPITGGFITGPDNRPEYCDENGCIPDAVFENLPAIPSDFNIVKTKVHASLYPVVEHFSCKQWNEDYSECLEYNPDEWYYLQPEFYGNPPTWVSQGVHYYTGLGEGRGYDYLGITGFGAYPSSIIIRPVEPGQDLKAVTYVQASWFVRNWQGMSISVIYPPSDITGFGTFEVEQNPDEVKNYFEVDVNPDNFLLEPTFPVFKKEWAKKVEVNIHVKENTPPGKYLISLNPLPPSDYYSIRWFNQYEFNYHSVGGLGLAGGVYKIFIEIV